MAEPVFRAVRSDDTEHDITEGELYRYTRHRWLYNEAYHLSQRYLKFNLQELLKAASIAIDVKGFVRCTKILKCKEGLNNKVFLLTMTNGIEICAKLPHPGAGPSFYTTASEVATHHFLRDVLNISTPRIIAWSADRNNPVGAEYILEEKAQGEQLGKLWQDWHEWPMRARAGVIEQVVQMEHILASTKFAKSGSIYFREDIAGSDPLAVISPMDSTVLERFTIGPLVEHRLWRGERAVMDLNRGPYNDAHELVEAIAMNEKKYISLYAHSRMNYARSVTGYEQPKDAIDLLDRYLQLTPAMVPPKHEADIHSATLWHPDLHLNNVFVDPKSKRINQVIDWQSAAVLPFFHQCRVPPMFRHPRPIDDDLNTLQKRPGNYKDLNQDEKKQIDILIASEGIHKYYLGTTHNQNQRHWVALQLKDDLRTQPAHIVPNIWEESNVFYLRRALLRIVGAWEDLCLDRGPCPVTFTDEELAQHAQEAENMEAVSGVLTLFRDRWGLPPDGSVESAGYEEVKAELSQMREAFIEAADNEEDKFLAEKLWPYQDTDERPKRETSHRGCEEVEETRFNRLVLLV